MQDVIPKRGMEPMSKKILLVSDDDDIVLILTRFLEKHGYDVTEASLGEGCLSKITEFEPDLVIVDIPILEFGGWEICKRIKENDACSIPVSILTSIDDPEDRTKILEHTHADYILEKPIDFRTLMQTIEGIDGYNLQESLEKDYQIPVE